MRRALEAYSEYKDSGVEWLGEVPAHWKMRKVRQCASISGGMTPSMEDGRFWNGDLPWVTPKDMKTTVIGDSHLRVTDAALAETPLRLVQSPAVLMVVRGMILARRVPIARTTSPVTINQDMKALQPGPALNAAYLALFLACAHDGLFPLIDEAGHGTRRLPTERWRDLPLTVPPQAEQTAIVRFLDYVDREIRPLLRSKWVEGGWRGLFRGVEAPRGGRAASPMRRLEARRTRRWPGARRPRRRHGPSRPLAGSQEWPRRANSGPD